MVTTDEQLHPPCPSVLSDRPRLPPNADLLISAGSNIGVQGAAVLAGALRVNKTLKVLRLGCEAPSDRSPSRPCLPGILRGLLTACASSGNNIGDEGATYLGGALRVNQALEHLELTCEEAWSRVAD